MSVDLQELKTQYFLFDPAPFGRIFAFVDFGNVRPWAKEIWPEENRFKFFIEIDIFKIKELCRWVNTKHDFFYYGYYGKDNNLPVNSIDQKHRNSVFRIDKAEKCGFDVTTKEIKLIPHYNDSGAFVGRFPKCNFDVEITMDILKRVNEYDSIILFSGDSDFGGLLKYLKSMNKKVIVICTRNRMSRELEEVADKFIPAETLASFLKYNRKNNTPPVKAEV